MVNLEINFAGLKFKNPILTASGTFGYGTEFADFIDLNLLGGFIVKGTTLNHREGNPYPRMAETASGMLNAVGLQNKGVKYFCENIYPEIKDLKTNIFVNVSGSTIEDYVATAEMINNLENIPGIELNISCPNVKEGGMAFGTSCTSAAQVVKEVRKVYKKHLMVKLSPNVTDIVSIAQAVESEGADSISLINTFLGMAIDAKTRKPKLSTITGGLSGPAIKPIALRMVWQVSKVVKIPICGLGGIMNAEDVIEFMLAGASCVQIGTANFIDPDITIKIINDLQVFCENQNIKNIDKIIGKLIS
ncbi:MAG TPA: dihydroorotate dehydrogenase [Bacteroidales bacterium]|nr:dihydroorotate dehydrogenase [Bacteroidales bacterium]HOR59658.1 dihydroorotate dehydrogenase [Bacteroidales bacterium]HPL05062.1 dihydroorotate dehydrogenase [Bacteroidales bacterium]